MAPLPVFFLALVAVTCAPLLAPSDDRTVVPLADDEWGARLAAALGAIEAGEHAWGVAALQEALDADAPVVVRVSESLEASTRFGEGPRGRAAGRDRGRRFLALETLARSLIAALPEEALRVYRERYAEVGENLFRRYSAGGDRRALERLGRRYFFASRGVEARELVADRYLEGGRYRDAYVQYAAILNALDRLPSESHPSRRHRLAVKVLLALRRMGEDLLYAESRAAFLAALNDPAARERLAASLRGLEGRVPLLRVDERPARAAASRWGGEIRRGALPELPAESLELSWVSWVWSDDYSIVERAAPRPARPRFGRRVIPHPLYDFDRYSAVEYPFVPVVDGENLWISGVFHVFQLDSRPGVGIALRECSKPDPSRLEFDYREDSDSVVYTLSLWKRARDEDRSRNLRRSGEGVPHEVLIGHYVSDRIEHLPFMNYNVTEEIPIRSLVAFDPRAGRILWRTLVRDDPKPEGGARGELPPAGERPAGRGRPSGPFRERISRRRGQLNVQEIYGPIVNPADISYTSPVLVRRGIVYAGGWTEKGYVNAVVRALDLKTGRKIWESLLSSSQMETTMFGETAREPFASFLLERDGVLYCQTNLGAVAALDASTGRPLWISSYDTIPVPQPRGPVAPTRELAWGAGPPLLLGHIIVVAPRDSEFLYAFDTGTGPAGEQAAGRVVWRYNNVDRDLRDLLGYHGGRLYFTGPAGVAYLDLSGLEPLSRAAPGGFLRSPRKKLASGFPRKSIPARGALTNAGVVFSDFQRLWLVDLDLKTRRPLTGGRFPPSDHGSYPGRIQIAGGVVLMTSNRLLSAFAPAAE